MSNKKIIFLSTTILLAVIGLSMAISPSRSVILSDRRESKDLTPSSQPSPTFSPQTNSEAEVDVTIQPLTLETGKNPSFKIELNTHSVELDFDITQISDLTDDNNSSYTNPVWEGSPPEGHHRSGTLTFDNPLKEAKNYTLTLSGIAGVPQRQFSWNMTNK